MINYESAQLSQTLKTVAISSILAGSAFALVPADGGASLKQNPNKQISLSATSQTYGTRNELFSYHNLSFGSPSFEMFSAEFYDKLSTSQQELGADFERVLFDNLWNLYID